MRDYVPVIAAVASAVAAYLFARWGQSIEMRSTEATQLWEESRRIREELRGEVAALETEIEALRADRDRLAAEVVRLQEANAQLRSDRDRLEMETGALRMEIAALREILRKGD